MTTTAQNTKITKISLNFPATKSPGKCTVSVDPWANRPKKSAEMAHKNKNKNKNKQTKHWETRRNFTIVRNDQIPKVI